MHFQDGNTLNMGYFRGILILKSHYVSFHKHLYQDLSASYITDFFLKKIGYEGKSNSIALIKSGLKSFAKPDMASQNQRKKLR